MADSRVTVSRRAFLTTAVAIAAASRTRAQTPAQSRQRKSSTFVLVPGGYHGAWCYKRVTDRLRAQGHTVYPLTLTGLGERAHLMSPSVNLDTHITDVLNVLVWEDLRDVHLVGHSYGGMVITGVADRAPERLARVIYFDALWPKDGESVNIALGNRTNQSGVLTEPDPARPPRLPNAVAVAKMMGASTPEDIEWLASKMTPQPPATLVQPIRLKGPTIPVPVLFIACVKPAVGGVTASYERAKERAAKDKRVRTVELKAPHDAMVTHPDDVVKTLVNFIG